MLSNLLCKMELLSYWPNRKKRLHPCVSSWMMELLKPLMHEEGALYSVRPPTPLLCFFALNSKYLQKISSENFVLHPDIKFTGYPSNDLGRILDIRTLKYFDIYQAKNKKKKENCIKELNQGNWKFFVLFLWLHNVLHGQELYLKH